MDSWLKSSLSIIDSISEWLAKGAAFLAVITAVLVTVEAILRYVFNAPTIWNLELVTYLCMVLYIMGGAYVHSLKAHVKVDVFYMRFKPRGQAILDLVALPFFLAFGGVLLWYGTKWMWTALVGWEYSGTQWEIPIFPLRLILPLATFFLLLQGVANLVRTVRITIKGRES